MNSHISTKENEFIIKVLLRRKNAGLDDFLDEFYQAFKEQIIPTYTNSSRKLRREYFLYR